MRKFIALLLLLGILTACSSAADNQTAFQSGAGKLKVIATTTIIGDMVANVGGDAIDLTVLLPIGASPHAFEPTPKDVTIVSKADVVFSNGFKLEEFLNDLIANAATSATIVEVSQGIEPLQLQQSDGDEHGNIDPHTWTTPVNGIVFVKNIEAALIAADPANAKTYTANAEKYSAQLQDLDAWVRAQIETIPPEHRKLVTGHTAFGYFAHEYGLEQIGTVIPGFSSVSEPSAQELAALQDAIEAQGVKAIFIGTDLNPTVSQQIANDTGIQLYRLYTGTLDEPGSGVETYIEYIEYNTNTIVNALR